MAPNPDLLVWIDLEMTGLEPETCFILEIATLVTDAKLQIVAEGPNIVVHNGERELESLSEWSRKTFGKSGLIERVRNSAIDAAAAEDQTLAFLAPLVKAGASPMCGNSVHNDRVFLHRHMRRLHDFFHYRNLDVSTVKELCRRWYGSRFKPPQKADSHQALQDIRESVAELRYYRESFFAP